MYVVRYEGIELGKTVYYKYTSKYEGRNIESKRPKFTDDITKAKQFKTLKGANHFISVLIADYGYPQEYLSLEVI